MTGPRARSIAAFSLLLISFLAYGFGVWLDAAINPQGPGESTHWSDAFWPAAFLGFPVVGAVIASRLPRNVIGWLLCAVGTSISVATFASEYAQFAHVSREGAPAGEFFASLTTWVHFIAVGALLAMLIAFPTGSPRNRFWRWIVTWVTGACLALSVLYATRPGPLDGVREIDNPLGVSWMQTPGEWLIPILSLSLVAVMIVAIFDKVWTFIRSTGIQRQQIKSFALAALIFPVLFALAIASEGVIGGQGNEGEFDPVVLAFFFGFNGLAAAIGFAVFKHRLYEIDVVINRALVYGVLTAILVTSYLGLVFGFQALLAPVTAESDLAIAGSTLAVAALFQPIRSRVQSFIDRRFYRRKVDAQRTLEEFSSRLRDEVDLASLSTQLATVVNETMQPAHVSLWLRSQS
jgi:hypothetical protein